MDTVHECDRQTDGQTDGRTDGRTDRITITNTVQRITIITLDLYCKARLLMCIGPQGPRGEPGATGQPGGGVSGKYYREVLAVEPSVLT